MKHPQLTTMEQMQEEYVLYCQDLLSDGHIGDALTFVEVMAEWALDDGSWRLEGKNWDVIERFLRSHKVDDDMIVDLLRWWVKHNG